jgi:cation diffusion facilitator family transporter
VKKDRRSLAYLEGTVSLILNLVLFGLKYWAGLVSGSVAIIADAWHTLSDSITSLVVIIGAKAAHKPADEKHPFGHGRAELIASVIIGVLLGMVGFNFVLESVEKLQSRQAGGFGTLAVVVFAVSVVLKETMARFAIHAGKKSGYRSLAADGWHHRSDAVASALILAGIFLGRRFWWIDGALGIAVALLIIYAAFDVIRDAVDPLMGKAADEKLIEQLRQIGREVAGQPLHVHHVHIHEYGSNTELTLHINMDGSIPLERAHEMGSAFEKAVRERLDMEATVHIEPGGEAD